MFVQQTLFYCTNVRKWASIVETNNTVLVGDWQLSTMYRKNGKGGDSNTTLWNSSSRFNIQPNFHRLHFHVHNRWHPYRAESPSNAMHKHQFPETNVDQVAIKNHHTLIRSECDRNISVRRSSSVSSCPSLAIELISLTSSFVGDIIVNDDVASGFTPSGSVWYRTSISFDDEDLQYFQILIYIYDLKIIRKCSTIICGLFVLTISTDKLLREQNHARAETRWTRRARISGNHRRLIHYIRVDGCWQILKSTDINSKLI